MNLNSESNSAWNANAHFWSDAVGPSGNKYYQKLQLPVLNRLARIKPGEPALDLGTGNGLVARWLAGQGGNVTAVDGSERMIEIARREGQGTEGRIQYGVLDMTDLGGWEELLDEAEKVGGYEVIVTNMVLMDLATLEPLASVLPRLLRRNGRFVATLLHPVFHTTAGSRNIELKVNRENGSTEIIRSFSLNQYMNVPPMRGVAIDGQPQLQVYFHRPLHELLSIFFKAGLVMDALEEPTFDESDAREEIDAVENFREMPQIMAFRMRKTDLFN